MAHPRPFRLGIAVTTQLSAEDWIALARKVEDLGYSTLMLSDHFGDQLAPVPALAAAAAATTKLRVGSLVFDNDFRHPVVLAKEAATLDVLSGGRLELGLGAGWMNTDYEQSGIALDPAGVRVRRLAEAVTVLKGLFIEGAFSYSGEHYTISDLDGRPKPIQRPHPPLLIELNMLAFAVRVTEDRAATMARVAPRFGVDPAEFDDFPHALFGTETQIVEQLQSARARWDISYWTTRPMSTPWPPSSPPLPALDRRLTAARAVRDRPLVRAPILGPRACPEGTWGMR